MADMVNSVHGNIEVNFLFMCGSLVSFKMEDWAIKIDKEIHCSNLRRSYIAKEKNIILD